MTIAEELARIRPGTRVRVYHRAGAERFATSGTLVSLADGVVRVVPLTGSEELAIEVAAVTCVNVLNTREPRRPWAMVGRALAGAVLFGLVGYPVGLVIAMSGTAAEATAYRVWAGFILFGAVAGALSRRLGNPLALLDPWAARSGWWRRRLRRP